MRLLLCLLLLLSGSALAGRGGSDRSVAALARGSRPAATDAPRLCETAIVAAEFAARMPARLLTAISLTESGRIDPANDVLRAWPWTINADGEGRFFATKQDAIAAVEALRARGVLSIDVGCLQINLMFHPHAFTSLAEAFDPGSNALYAARFLNLLYEDGRDWSRAIAAYHSETPALGKAYRGLVLMRWQNPGPIDPRRTSFVYQDFAPRSRAYGSFTAAGRVYGAFADRLAMR